MGHQSQAQSSNGSLTAAMLATCKEQHPRATAGSNAWELAAADQAVDRGRTHNRTPLVAIRVPAEGMEPEKISFLSCFAYMTTG
jgi:hypothetical protein